jgi:hypothetical protein
MTVKQVIEHTRRSSRLVDKLVLTCLDASNISASGIDVVWEKCKATCEEAVSGRDGFLDAEGIWPDKVLPPVQSKGEGKVED